MKTILSKSGAATPQKKDRFDKKNVNTRVNPFINFQIGLVAALVLSYAVIEITNIEVTENHKPRTIAATHIDDWGKTRFRLESEPKKQNKTNTPPAKEPQKTDPSKAPVVVPDSEPINDPVKKKPINSDSPTANTTDSNNSKSDSAPTTSSTTQAASPVKRVNTAYSVGVMPLFPGCESLDNNDDRRTCFNEKINRFVNRKFNKDLANQVNLKDGEMVSIYISFTIDINGLPTNVKVKAPHEIFEKEAHRLIDRLPAMTPGKNNGEPVNVLFSLPIKFKVSH